MQKYKSHLFTNLKILSPAGVFPSTRNSIKNTFFSPKTHIPKFKGQERRSTGIG